mmetsp:Transcript_38522/g.79012  ORF Transcript_38522/g.79012 Transcript_38522/m.79012 type:complete len:178 (-) Transcript_38522:28-561(-)
MIKTSIINKVESWLLRMRRQDELSQVPSIPFSHVPPTFMYWARGHRWLWGKTKECPYNRQTYMHEFSGSEADFRGFFGHDITCIQVVPGKLDWSSSISVEPVEGLLTVRVKFSMKRPGSMLVTFAGLVKWGLLRLILPGEVAPSEFNTRERDKWLSQKLWDTRKDAAGTLRNQQQCL